MDKKRKLKYMLHKSHEKKIKRGYVISISKENFDKSSKNGFILVYATKINIEHLNNFFSGDKIIIGVFDNIKKKNNKINVTYRGYRVMDLEETKKINEQFKWIEPPIDGLSNNWRLKIIFDPIK